jgi:hypothetical protein
MGRLNLSDGFADVNLTQQRFAKRVKMLDFTL